MTQPLRVGSETLVAWKQWKEQVWKPCPFGVADQTKCSVHLCPCALVQVNRWVNGISGYLATVKLVKYLHARNGNSSRDRQGRVPSSENPQKQAGAQNP